MRIRALINALIIFIVLIIGVVTPSVIEVITSGVVGVVVIVLPVDNALVFTSAVISAVIHIALEEPVNEVHASVVVVAFVCAVPIFVVLITIISVEIIE